MLVDMKINGAEIILDTSKMHETWLDKCLAYGVRRFVNDSYSGEKGQTKYDLCAALANKMESGEPLSEAERRAKVSADPVTALAVKNAKAALVALFKRISGKAKIEDMMVHEKVAPYFDLVGDKIAWNETSVMDYIARVKDKVDFMEAARVALSATDEGMSDL